MQLYSQLNIMPGTNKNTKVAKDTGFKPMHAIYNVA